jgi:alpha-galactosidase
MGLGRDAAATYAAYGDAVAERLGVSVSGVPPTGWATWSVHWSDVTEDDVRRELAAATGIWSARDDLGSPVLQVDDGWEVRWGDWTASPELPSGTASLASDIAAAGFVPGLWMAPFYVSRDSATYSANPDWWVRDGAGEELSFSNLGSGDYAVLDVTHPDAATWLQNEISAKVAEGWTYLKLDFLYAGAQEGARAEDVTGVEAYHRGLALIREAAGAGTWILACGAPMLPTVGYADSYRTGADIAFEADRDPRPEYLRWQARATAARSWQNGAWWWIDADQILLRDPVDDVLATGTIASVVASGGVWLLGDDLDALDPDRLALALHPDLVALRGRRARPLDALSFPSGLDGGPPGELVSPDDSVPTTWILDDGAVVLLALGDEANLLAPPGTEVVSGIDSPVLSERTLADGAGEVWRP